MEDEGEMNLRIGEIVFPLLVFLTIMWDIKRGFRGFVFQLLGALCVGTVLNFMAHPHLSPGKKLIGILLWSLLTIACYSWVSHVRYRKT